MKGVRFMLRKLLFYLLLLILLMVGVKYIEKQYEINVFSEVESKLNQANEKYKITDTFFSIIDEIKGLFGEAEIGEDLEEFSEEIRKEVKLEKPTKHLFSIHNIEIGQPKEMVEHQLGKEKRVSMNEYGTNWYTYHQNYQQFVMVAYDNEQNVAGLYTNQNLITSTVGIKFGTAKEQVRQILGEPLEKIQKGFIVYQIQKDRDYDIFHHNDSYITIFYDKHANDTVTAIQIISEKLENKKTNVYTPASEELKIGFEYQLFDLTNASRVNHGLSVLTWDEHVQQTARKHSKDMAEHNYFSHTNLKGESPFDRMLRDAVKFTLAGENLAYGQLSSIFAHEGLMNSKGHRENILQPDFQYLGVGVAFNSESHPYYTQNFYAK